MAGSAIAYSDHVHVGGSLAWRANNPGNLRAASTKIGEVSGAVGKFAVFATLADGRAAQRALYLDRYGAMKVRDAIDKLTPPSENDTAGYVAALTDVIEIRGEHLRRAQAMAFKGGSIGIRLPATGKAAWRRVARGGRDELLAVSCLPVDGGFVTRWRRFVAGRTGWRVVEREATGLWESDQPFPPAKAFPWGKARIR
jgi:hypothetical protein